MPVAAVNADALAIAHELIGHVPCASLGAVLAFFLSVKEATIRLSTVLSSIGGRRLEGLSPIRGGQFSAPMCGAAERRLSSGRTVFSPEQALHPETDCATARVAVCC
jgi:hypothetical protein